MDDNQTQIVTVETLGGETDFPTHKLKWESPVFAKLPAVDARSSVTPSPYFDGSQYS